MAASASSLGCRADTHCCGLASGWKSQTCCGFTSAVLGCGLLLEEWDLGTSYKAHQSKAAIICPPSPERTPLPRWICAAPLYV